MGYDSTSNARSQLLAIYIYAYKRWLIFNFFFHDMMFVKNEIAQI